MSLYRKWRPQRFSDLKGQDSIRDTIFYAVTHGQLSQAYLFCGPRGTGKTTTARLIAKIVNCLTESNERPCNTCTACTSITNGGNLDVLEVDAASNRGIDEIRQLRDSVRFAPTQAKYKIYIIDEVHMLTREAFNALLKTLEEPPTYAIFILATTEAHKIPPTIISRCQRYDFRIASVETLTQHLEFVAKEEGMTLTPDAAQFLARLAEGSFRDALSLLDQVKSTDLPTHDLQTIETLFGYVPQEQMEQCFTAILSGSIDAAHEGIDAIVARGGDLRAFASQMLELSQRAMESAASGRFEGLSSEMARVVQQVGLKGLIIWTEMLLSALDAMKQSPITRLPLDVAIAKLALQSGIVKPLPERKAVSAPQTVAHQVAPLDREVTSRVKASETELPSDQKHEAAAVAVHETVTVPVAVTIPESIEGEKWRSVLHQLKQEAPSLMTSLSHAKVMGIERNTLTVAVKYKMHADKINQVRNREKIESILEEVFQSPLKIEAIMVKDLVIEDESADIAEVFEFEE